MPSFRDFADRVLGRRSEPERLELPTPPTSQEILADLDAFEEGLDQRVPPAVTARVARVSATVRDTIPRLDQLGAGSQTAHTVVATATSYLPEAVGAYLRLPRSWADRRPVSNGKTSLMLLCDQLDLLGYTMDKVFDAVCRADAEALVAHGAFLAEKFGQHSALEIGGPTPGSPTGGGPTSGSPTPGGVPPAGRLQPPTSGQLEPPDPT